MTTFISYSRANSEFATRFARDLKNAGFGIWLDQLDIPKGSRWDDEIERALDSSSTFIIILSPEAIESQNVKDELGYAIDHGKKILPVLLQPCKIPFRLRRFQFVDFTNRPYQDGLAEIQSLLVNTKQLATAKDNEGEQAQTKTAWIADSTLEERNPPIKKLLPKLNTQVAVALIVLVGIVITALLSSPLSENWFAFQSEPNSNATIPVESKSSLASITAILPPSYDFVSSMCLANWSNGSTGQLPCPGKTSDQTGFVIKTDVSELEESTIDTRPGLLTAPQNTILDYIRGIYPEYEVLAGDRFRATIGCQSGSTSCDVVYRLDYQISSGAIKNFREYTNEYDGVTYDIDLDLSPLVGETVKFILTVLPSQLSSENHAIWVAPVIVNVKCDVVQFIRDVTVPDGTKVSQNQEFTKTWRFKNVGTCTWTSNYRFVFYSGEDMNAPLTANFPIAVPPGQAVDISLKMQAPSTPGKYRGYWIFQDSSGREFGLGKDRNRPIWVDIEVISEISTNAP